MTTILDDDVQANAEVITKVFGRDVTRGQLLAAFDSVADSANWKNPIDRLVTVEDDFEKSLIATAVQFFTGSFAKFSTWGEGYYRVTAAGYYATCGA